MALPFAISVATTASIFRRIKKPRHPSHQGFQHKQLVVRMIDHRRFFNELLPVAHTENRYWDFYLVNNIG